ncbi:MAG: DUF4350 domain-containing protein [Flavisolibacter sp.]
MKKAAPYIIIGALVLVFAVLLIRFSGRQRQFDERITLKQKDKVPYGMSAAYHLLGELYPNASILTSSYPQWMHSADTNAAIILVADRFSADEDEMLSLLSYLAKGNTVLLAARSFSADAKKYLGFTQSPVFPQQLQSSGLSVRLKKPYFNDDSIYSYPGFSFTQSLTGFDDSLAVVLGSDADGRPNFFQFRKGKGSLFVHLSPLVFSNYFVLHKNNSQYFESVLSVLKNPQRIQWNETYLQPPPAKEKDKGWLSGLLKYESFRWSFGLALLALLLFVLLGMRRQQRMAPVHQKPVNDSFEFIKTLGRLYYEKGDHLDLAKKMSVYFTEHVRSRYKISLSSADEGFVKVLHLKSGYPEAKLQPLINFIRALPQRQKITEAELVTFYQQLALFYQKTGTWQKNSSNQERISAN